MDEEPVLRVDGCAICLAGEGGLRVGGLHGVLCVCVLCVVYVSVAPAKKRMRMDPVLLGIILLCIDACR
jgi:hypothetical protein